MMFTPPEPSKKEPRRIVQISNMPESEHFRPMTFALCNDGTFWMLPHYTGAPGEWQRLPEIPQ